MENNLSSSREDEIQPSQARRYADNNNNNGTASASGNGSAVERKKKKLQKLRMMQESQDMLDDIESDSD